MGHEKLSSGDLLELMALAHRLPALEYRRRREILKILTNPVSPGAEVLLRQVGAPERQESEAPVRAHPLASGVYSFAETCLLLRVDAERLNQLADAGELRKYSGQDGEYFQASQVDLYRGVTPPPLEKPSEFYTFEEVMRVLNIDENRLKRLVSEGEIRAFREGHEMKFKRSEVDNLSPSYSLTETAKQFGVDEEKLKRLVSAGSVPHFMLRGEPRFRKYDSDKISKGIRGS